jgi:hypothetical protein
LKVQCAPFFAEQRPAERPTGSAWLNPEQGHIEFAREATPSGLKATAIQESSLSPDGIRLVSSGEDGLKVWDAQTGQELLTMKER